MTNDQWVVLEDPQQQFWEGALVGLAQARVLEARGVVVLPVDTELMRLSGVGGYHKRAWGAGWELPLNAPQTFCNLTLFCLREYTRLSWKAKVVVDAGSMEAVEERKLRGFLRITPDGSQVSPYKMGLRQEDVVDFSSYGIPQMHDGAFIIGGTASTFVPTDAHYGLALYGMGLGLRVAWAAVSQTRV